MKITTYGNTDILKLHKTAFLASGTIPPIWYYDVMTGLQTCVTKENALLVALIPNWNRMYCTFF
jgi:hypothetical protein